MATTGPGQGLPLQTWTCPHCGEVWHTGRQYCSTCKHGMVQDAYGAWAPTGASGPPPPYGGQSGPLAPPHVPSPVAAPPLAEDFRASVAAESQLQAEVT